MTIPTATIGAYPKPGYVPILDCGPGTLSRRQVRAKLANMVAAAQLV